tara:strand:+ start:126 stop:419 length:294 start_codon:yes stop_codon:yes gene_type:complete
LITLQPFLLLVLLQLDGYLPGGTSIHAMLLFEYFPGEHNLHEVAIVFIGWIVPGEHVSHKALPYLLVAFPAKHGKHDGYEAFSTKYLPGWQGKHCRP